MVAEDIIIKPIISEKSSYAVSQGKYTFKVNKNATKVDVRNAVEKLFEVKVLDVKTVNVKGKPKRQGVHEGMTQDWKKAIVTIDTNPQEKSFLDKGGKAKKLDKKYKTSIEEFGA